ncbi:hypothetical protein AGLY_013100 [Aphis glycines]|uniref:Uncharacterized protein n=1 Tax=Aphis glycines TaxID=307491 RepID=A0A6G0T9U7_APHGL|nr:hypothetical protein AGLY_013100 [Aphis glycines]
MFNILTKKTYKIYFCEILGYLIIIIFQDDKQKSYNKNIRYGRINKELPWNKLSIAFCTLVGKTPTSSLMCSSFFSFSTVISLWSCNKFNNVIIPSGCLSPKGKPHSDIGMPESPGTPWSISTVTLLYNLFSSRTTKTYNVPLCAKVPSTRLIGISGLGNNKSTFITIGDNDFTIIRSIWIHHIRHQNLLLFHFLLILHFYKRKVLLFFAHNIVWRILS